MANSVAEQAALKMRHDARAGNLDLVQEVQDIARCLWESGRVRATQGVSYQEEFTHTDYAGWSLCRLTDIYGYLITAMELRFNGVLMAQSWPDEYDVGARRAVQVWTVGRYLNGVPFGWEFITA